MASADCLLCREPNLGSLIILLAVEDPQNSQEEVDDIEIQADRRRDLLLNVIVAHDHLSVHENVTGKYQRGDASIHQFHRLSAGEECGHEPEDDEKPQRAEQIRLPRREVVLALAGEQGEEGEHGQRDDERLHNDAGVVEARDDRNAVRFEAGKSSQEDQVGRVRLALPEGEEQEGDGAEERAPHHPAVGLDP